MIVLFVVLLVAFLSETEGNSMQPSRVSGLAAIEQSIGFRIEDAVDLSRNPLFNPKSSGQSSDPLQFGAFSKVQPLASTDITPAAARIGSLAVLQQKGQQPNLVSSSSGHIENWGESTMGDASPKTDTSTDVDTDDKNQRVI
uniref:Transcription factor HBP-1b(C1) isoform X1 n=1 Tax=Elaeis guineensis var. tenera TaxID=51953 RepID=A0A8N4IBS2_ELAGV|nr:transcription factor HBP-1b(c1) isoform X1 [Elaeis guineensis]